MNPNLLSTYVAPGQRERLQQRMEQALKRRLPEALQAPAIRMATAAMTWLSMQPSSRDMHRRNRSTFNRFIVRLGTLAAVTATSLATTTLLPWYAAIFAAIPFALVQVGIIRHFAIGEGHMAAHDHVLTNDMVPKTLWSDVTNPDERKQLANDFVGRWATAAGLITPHPNYKKDHDKHHDLASFANDHDPDVPVLVKRMGFVPGADAETQRRRYRQYLWSIVNHASWFAERLRINLGKAQPDPELTAEEAEENHRYLALMRKHRVAAAAVTLVLLMPVLFVPLYAWLLAIVLPWSVGVQLSAQLQLPTLHLWMVTNDPAETAEMTANRMQGRFPLTPPPEERFSVTSAAWIKWAAEVMLFDLPFRVAVLNSQLANHDAHHLGWFTEPRDEEWDEQWHDLEVIRAELIANGDRFGMGTRELWGTRTILKSGAEAMAKSVPFKNE